MTTRAYVPNVDGEGSIGTTDKKWGAMYVASPDSMASDNRVASTAWVQKILADALAKQKAAYDDAISTAVKAAKTQAKLDAHPVGSYYWSNDSTSPAILFGGTWEALPAGYTLIAQGSGSDSFGSFTYEAGKQYGERMHKLTTDELPSHKHDSTIEDSLSIDTEVYRDAWYGATHWSTHYRFVDNNIKRTGGNQPHNNIPPSTAAYCWKRTA